MGLYVDKPAVEPFEWGENERFGTGVDSGSLSYVSAKYTQSLELANSMIEKLVGVDGNSGYLGALDSIITSYPAPNVSVEGVTVPDLDIPVDSRPAVDTSGLETSFPVFAATPPSLQTLPTVDLSSLNPADIPAEISAAISWVESEHVLSLYTPLFNRLIADLQSGATGLDSTVEQEIYDRALARQVIEDDKAQQQVEDYFTTRGFPLPTGAMAGRLQEQTNEQARRTLEINGKIMIEQAQLAQNNSQFAIQMANNLEAVLRDFTSRKNDRSLDYSKAVAANAISVYSESIRAYIAAAEANKIYVQTQVENLRAIVEYNKGLVDSYSAEAEAFNAVINAKAKKNEALIGAIEAEIKGYDSETKAIAESQKTKAAAYALRLQNADMQLRESIANAEQSTNGYTSESALREKVSEAMANIAMQAVASALGSVNASAGISNSASESISESWGHSESRSVGTSHSGNISESHSYSES